MDPFNFQELAKGAKVIGSHVILLPAATYPIHIRGLGGRSKETAMQLARELVEAVELMELTERQEPNAQADQ